MAEIVKPPNPAAAMAHLIRGERLLTEAQHNRLDQLAEDWPDAKVVGWRDDGPLIWYPQYGVRVVGADGVVGFTVEGPSR